MCSFLRGRKQYVELQGFQSTILPIGDCSVLQGNKKSGIFYTLYNLEKVFLPILMHRKTIFYQITGHTITDYSSVKHETINFVDDSTSVVAADDTDIFKTILTTSTA